jgi:hypothetical protein
MGIPITVAVHIHSPMDALYLAIETSDSDPINGRITHIAARLRRDDFTYVDLNLRAGEDNIIDALLQFNRLRQDCEILIGHNLQHQLDFLLAACVRTGNTSLFVQLRRYKILCTRALATQYHESEGKIGSTILSDLLDEFAGVPLSTNPDAQAQVVATKIIHQAIFGRLQKSPNFARVGQDLVQLNVN